jgi:hypothetical protein
MTNESILKLASQAGFRFTDTGHLCLDGADWHAEEVCAQNLRRFAQIVAIEAQIAFAKHMYDVACLSSVPPRHE